MKTQVDLMVEFHSLESVMDQASQLNSRGAHVGPTPTLGPKVVNFIIP